MAQSEKVTFDLQSGALKVWRGHVKYIFINEYLYESYLGDFSAWIIFQVTKSQLLSRIASLIAKLFPTLKANTFGVGVRFRTSKDWIKLFEETGFFIKGYRRGVSEPVSLARHLLVIKEIRRDSFLLASI